MDFAQRPVEVEAVAARRVDRPLDEDEEWYAEQEEHQCEIRGEERACEGRILAARVSGGGRCARPECG